MVSNGSQMCAVPKSSAVGVIASVGGKKPLHVSVAVLLPLAASLATTTVEENEPATGALHWTEIKMLSFTGTLNVCGQLTVPSPQTGSENVMPATEFRI